MFQPKIGGLGEAEEWSSHIYCSLLAADFKSNSSREHSGFCVCCNPHQTFLFKTLHNPCWSLCKLPAPTAFFRRDSPAQVNAQKAAFSLVLPALPLTWIGLSMLSSSSVKGSKISFSLLTFSLALMFLCLFSISCLSYLVPVWDGVIMPPHLWHILTGILCPHFETLWGRKGQEIFLSSKGTFTAKVVIMA